ncbi:unknown [Prevotella sp. CAG:755]|nr:unknown [Prevotella sp. CAG:755]
MSGVKVRTISFRRQRTDRHLRNSKVTALPFVTLPHMQAAFSVMTCHQMH